MVAFEFMLPTDGEPVSMGMMVCKLPGANCLILGDGSNFGNLFKLRSLSLI